MSYRHEDNGFAGWNRVFGTMVRVGIAAGTGLACGCVCDWRQLRAEQLPSSSSRHTRRVRVFVCLIGVLLCPRLGWGGMCVVFGEYDACMALAPAAVRARAARA